MYRGIIGRTERFIRHGNIDDISRQWTSLVGK